MANQPPPSSSPGQRPQPPRPSMPRGTERAIPKIGPRPVQQQPPRAAPPQQPVPVRPPIKASHGNKLGYILAGLLVSAIIVFIVLRVVAPSHSKATPATLQTGSLELMKPSVPVTNVIPSVPSGGGNAGDDYASAVKLSKEKRDVIGEALENSAKDGFMTIEPSAKTILESIASSISSGASNAKMDYTFTHTPATFRISQKFPEADELVQAWVDMEFLIYYYRANKNYSKAEQLSLDGFVMGWHMMNEHKKVQVCRSGIGIQKSAMAELTAIYQAQGGHEAELKSIKDYRRSLNKTGDTYTRLYTRVLWELRPEAGDVYNLAENSDEPALRVEAILALGRLKFSRNHDQGDKNYIDKLINKFISDSNPLYSAAAKAAKNLSIKEYRRLGSE